MYPISIRPSLINRIQCILRCLFTVLLFVVTTTAPETAQAQQNGVSIIPAQFDELLEPGTTVNYSFSVRNLNSTDETFYLFTRNISGVSDSRVPVFAVGNERTGYELADWISLSETELRLAPDERRSVDFTMTVPENAGPGSHFGGIFVSVEPPEITGSGASVGYQVANIVHVRVAGEAVEEASIRQFSTDKFLYGSQNVTFNARIENSGNVLVRPSGPLEIYNMLGNKVGNITFNPDSFAVFPKDTREFNDIVWEGDSLGFGRYEAILSPVYGEEGVRKTMSNTVTFWIIPWNIVGPILGVLALILIITFVCVRLYVRRSLAQLNRGRRVVRRRQKNSSSALLLFIVVSLMVTGLFLIVLLALFA